MTTFSKEDNFITHKMGQVVYGNTHYSKEEANR